MDIQTTRPHGPGTPFELLLAEAPADGRSLAEPWQALYGSDWRLLTPSPERPYTYVNFVTSHDGRISFDEPGHLGGGAISRLSRHDQWVMGLLRARADAILVGDATLRLEARHIWTAEAIFPDDAPAWSALRRQEDRAAAPLHVFLSLAGDIPRDAAVFARSDIPVLIATTDAGGRAAHARLRNLPQVEIRALGTSAVDLSALLRELRTTYGVRSLLCEGGAHVYGAMLAAGQVDDEFLTLSPIMVGNRPRGSGPPRPSLVEGVAFSPEHPPAYHLLSLRRSGSYIFMHSRLQRD
jgi:riboflavin biosynthesis pyrimidine reductase